MAISRKPTSRTTVTRDSQPEPQVVVPEPEPDPQVVVPEPEPDPDPEATYGAKRWADLQAANFIWYPMRKVAIYDEGQASETIAEP